MTSFRPRNLAECAGAFWRQRWLIIALAAVVLISAYFVIRQVPKIYQSRAVVVVADAGDDGLVTTGQIAAITEQLTSRATLEPIIEQHGLYKAMRDAGGMDLAVGRMRDAIAIETKVRRDMPESMTITYRYTDPATTRAVLEELVSRYSVANDEIRSRAEAELASLDGQLSSLDTQLESADRERSEMAARSVEAQQEFQEQQATRAARAAAASTIESLRSKEQSLVARIAGLQQQIKDQQALVDALPAPLPASGASGPLLVRRAELKAQLAEYAKLYTDKNPKVVDARQKLAEVEQQLKQLGGGVSEADRKAASPEAAELRGLNRDLATLQTELQITRQEIARRDSSAPAPVDTGTVAPAVFATAGMAAPDAGSSDARLRIKYQSLLNRQATLQRALPLAVAGGGVFRVVDPPSQPETPIGPNKALLATFALGLALGIALLVAGFLEARRVFRIQDDLDVAYFLGAPVLAAIPETLTPGENRRRRSTRLLRGATFAVLGIAAIPLLFALFSALHVFELLGRR